jgi:two-component system C4-dicarboxylate transport sensor histidine kinase DctB
MTPYDEFSASTYAGAPPATGGGNWRGFVAALIAGWVLLCALTWFVSMQRGLDSLRDAVAIRADRYAATLESTLARYEFLPSLVALHPFVRDLLVAPLDPARVDAANRYLAEVNARSQASATYVVATSGLGLAASNYDQPKSFIGFDYRFRPYFQSAMRGAVGRFYAIGITAEEPGYYIAQPVYADGKIIGAAVVKLGLEWFQQAGAGGTEPVVVSDEHGVIFLSTVPAWRYRSLKPLTAELRAEIERTRQYHNKDVQPLPMEPLQSLVTRWLDRLVLGGDAQLLRISTDNKAERYLQVSRRVGPANWTMLAMAALDPVMTNARNATIAAALAYACVCLLLLNRRLRRQRARDIEYGRSMLEAAYGELERRVDERTADLMATNERLEAEVRERTRAENELRATQDELVQTSKLAALGQMAAGITHELNQPLAALRTFSDNTRVLIERGQIEAATGNLAAIADLTTRMGKITGQLKLFAGKARPRKQAVPVRTALDHVLALMAPRLKHVQVEVEGLEASAEPAVLADELKLEQVLVNLIGNALDAIATKAEQGGEGTPIIGIDVAEDEGRVSLVVRDNGIGIPENVLPKLFEPFFTTKEIGQGLGLGLAISTSIVREFGGQLSAANRPEGGAEFTIVLNRASETATAKPGKQSR